MRHPDCLQSWRRLCTLTALRRGFVLRCPPMRSIEDFVRAMPMARLHLHIGGTLEPEMVFELARKHGLALPYPSVDALREAYRFSDLQSFLDVYYAGAQVLRDESD